MCRDLRNAPRSTADSAWYVRPRTSCLTPPGAGLAPFRAFPGIRLTFWPSFRAVTAAAVASSAESSPANAAGGPAAAAGPATADGTRSGTVAKASTVARATPRPRRRAITRTRS